VDGIITVIFLLKIHIDYLLQGDDRITTVIHPPVMKMRKTILLKRRTKQVVLYINLLLKCFYGISS
jgi:hypothetical protein